MTETSTIDFIKTRNASPKLKAPAPSQAELEQAFAAALRAPDHANLTPVRFKVIEGGGLSSLGELFVASERQTSGKLTDERTNKLLSMPRRAPMIIAAYASTIVHEKVPRIEQIISASCACQNLLLALESLGFQSIWRTGDLAFNPHVLEGLGLSDNDVFLGFIYVGKRDGKPKTIKPKPVDHYWTAWP